MSSGPVGSKLNLAIGDLKLSDKKKALNLSQQNNNNGMLLNFSQQDNSKKKGMFLNFPQPQGQQPVQPPPKRQHQHCSHNVVNLISSRGTTGTLNINEKVYSYTANDLIDLGEIGRGNFGCVNKMRHKDSSTEMAVKRLRATIDEKEQKQLLKELDVIMRTTDCQYIVQFYGAIFIEGDCWICMELMTTSMDKTYRAVHTIIKECIPEEIIGKIAYCVIKALDYLKTNLNIIHRDVKPSNILVDVHGQVKLCDFGISGQLVDSIARTRDAGCQPYMAPERIDPSVRRGYDVRSDVWSLGMSLIEITIGKFPYPQWSTIFEQLSQVIDGQPPQIKNTEQQTFSPQCLAAVNCCMEKDFEKRPKYQELLRHPFIQAYEKDNNIKDWFSDILTKIPNLTLLEIDSL